MKRAKMSMLILISFVAQSVWADGSKLFIGETPFDPATVQSIQSFDQIQNEWIVQFDRAITEELKSQLKNIGLRVNGYIPENALVVSGSQFKKLVGQLEGVRAYVPMKPEWKISSSLKGISVFSASEMTALHVRTYHPTELKSREGLNVLESNGRYHLVQAHKREVLKLAKQSNVELVELAPEMELFLMPFKAQANSVGFMPATRTGFESGTKIAGFEAAWERGFSGRGQKAAVSDTGLDMGVVGRLHPDFSGVRKGYKFGLFAQDWRDPQGHGTHVAGSIGGNGAASNGFLRGGAYDSEIIPQGMWSPILNNLSVPPQLADMFRPAYSDGARIHSNSWGSPRDLGAYTGMSAQVDEFMWNNPEFLILFAAGNSGVDGDKDGRIDEGSVSSPGTAKNALTVGASENYLLEGGIQRTLGELARGEPWSTEPLKSDRLSDDQNGLAAFSSRGPTRDGRLKPEIVAPGTNIVSVCSRVEDATNLWGNYDENYCYAGGTSMSTPITAGGAAVARQYLSEKHNISSPSAALVKGMMMHTAFNLFPGQYGEIGKSAGQEMLVDGPNVHQGFGRLDMDRLTTDNVYYQMVDNKQGVRAGESFKVTVNVDDNQPLKVTLVYTDAPATASASRTLVNNLDLKITMAGQELLSDSRVNNFEQIAMSQLTGPVEIEVIGASVPNGKNGAQPFALVIGR